MREQALPCGGSAGWNLNAASPPEGRGNPSSHRGTEGTSVTLSCTASVCDAVHTPGTQPLSSKAVRSLLEH